MILVLIFFWIFLAALVFQDEISDILSAYAERARNPKPTPFELFYKNNPTPTYNYEKRTYRRKIDDGPWEDIPPEQWEEEESTIKSFLDEQEDFFNHWRDVYDDERKQRGEPERKYGKGDHAGPTV